MRILIIGSGGREHALAWKLKQSPKVDEIFVAPGNGGTASLARNLPVSDGDVPALVAWAREHGIDFVVPGPELPLTLGVVDAMTKAGIPCFGPSAACARLEGSKAFAKEIMQAAGVPTAACGVFSDKESARAFAFEHGAPLVIKADGLAAGKGVVVAMTMQEIDAALNDMFSGRFGAAGETVLMEEFLQGEEVSLLCFCDGESALPLPSAQDHKAAFDGDKGPNTGGMGAYSPAPVLPDADLGRMADLTVRPVLREMARRGTPFKGILYAGLMMTDNGPKVLEYNVRFGDPECQPLLMRLDEDLLGLLRACVDGTLAGRTLRLKPQAALGVVLTAAGYPGSYPKGMEISGINSAERLASVRVFQAGTRREGDKVFANGGRVLCVTALGEDLADAQKHAYEAMNCISMPDSFYRRDIGAKGLKRLQGVRGKHMTQVAIFIGSASDEPVISPCAEVLKKLGISFRFTVSSAHRTPERTEALVRELEEDGCQVFICAAGMAAHLAGAVAARTTRPVIGIPVAGSALGGMDALLSTVQMPPGFPVATVALDKAGARNAAWLAAQILALHDENLAKALHAERDSFKAAVERAGAELEAKHVN